MSNRPSVMIQMIQVTPPKQRLIFSGDSMAPQNPLHTDHVSLFFVARFHGPCICASNFSLFCNFSAFCLYAQSIFTPHRWKSYTHRFCINCAGLFLPLDVSRGGVKKCTQEFTAQIIDSFSLATVNSLSLCSFKD